MNLAYADPPYLGCCKLYDPAMTDPAPETTDRPDRLPHGPDGRWPEVPESLS